MKKVAGYIRVSGLGQNDGDGPTRQEEAIKFFATAFQLDLVHCYHETLSGATDMADRPAFLAALDEAERLGVKAIIVERLDRLARDLMVSELLLGECRKRGLQVFATDQCQLTDMASDGGDPTRKLIRQIMGALAEWERSCIVKKLRVARMRARLAGRCEGAKPYGVLPGEKHVLDIMKGMYATGASMTTIAEYLNQSGHVTRRGKQWNVGTVYNLLSERSLAQNRKRKT